MDRFRDALRSTSRIPSESLRDTEHTKAGLLLPCCLAALLVPCLAPCLASLLGPTHIRLRVPRRHVAHGEFDAHRIQPRSDAGPEATAPELSRRERGKRRTRPLVQPRRKPPRKGCHCWQGPVTAPKCQATAADCRFQCAYPSHYPGLTSSP